MPILLFNNLTEEDKKDAIENLICESSPRQDFFLMVVLSILMATFGVLADSIAVVIGSMLIAPMLYPVLSLSMGIVTANSKLITRSFFTILKSVIFGIAASAFVTLFFNSPEFIESSNNIISKMVPSLIYLSIAIVSGLAVSYALARPQLSETLPGVAVTVALVPPLAVVGIGVARWDWGIISNSLLLVLINIIGIVFASMIIFSLMNLFIKRSVVKETLEKEEKAMEKAISKNKRKKNWC